MKNAMIVMVMGLFLGACAHMHGHGGHGCCKDGQCAMHEKGGKDGKDCGCGKEKAEKPAESK